MGPTTHKQKALQAIEHFILQHERKMKNHHVPTQFTHGNKTWTITQLHIASLIKEKPSQSNNTFLAQQLKLSKPAVTKAINTLIEKDMVIAQKKKDNQKSIFYTLTDTGQQLAELHDRMHEIAIERYNQLLDSFSEDDLEVIAKFLNTWSNQL